MSEHEWRRGGPALAPVKVALDQDGCIGVRVETLTGLTRYFDPSDLIPDDRHRTPIAPEDVREGDVVRIEWEEAHEGPVRSTPNGPRVDSYYVDYPGRTVYLIHRAPTERDKWWPPQPGDVAEWGGGQRWVCRNDAGNDDDWYWVRLGGAYGTATDADVPDDAVLVLPAQTREATS